MKEGIERWDEGRQGNRKKGKEREKQGKKE